MAALKVFYVPTKTKYVIVSDMFAEDYSGGAELTLEALLDKAPGNIFKLHSELLTPALVEANKDKVWILGNFTRATKESLIELVVSGVEYNIIECDYKYCRYRSSHLHKLQDGKDCDCHSKDYGIFIRGFFQRANKVFFMSEAQMNEYIQLFPQAAPHNFVVQSSTFSETTLTEIKALRERRSTQDLNDVWAVLSGGSWIKAERQTIEWCEFLGLKYELIGGLTPENFLKKLSLMKGLVFKPAGWDTCPRLVIEAKLLGLGLLLNDNVQHKTETWFTGDVETCENYLKTRIKFFWDEVSQIND